MRAFVSFGLIRSLVNCLQEDDDSVREIVAKIFGLLSTVDGQKQKIIDVVIRDVRTRKIS